VAPLTCDRCGTICENGDNFCRRCGQRMPSSLPVVRTPNLPIRTNALPQPLVRSVAVLAVGTGLEWLARRFAGTAARAAGRALIGLDRPASSQTSLSKAQQLPSEAVIDEVLYVRKVQLRR
jgi:hypothetical protein